MTSNSETTPRRLGKANTCRADSGAGLTNILIIRLSSFGDIVLAEPVSRLVREHYPGCNIWFLANEEYTGIPNLFEAVDTVLPYFRVGSNDRLMGMIGDVDFDVVVDLQNSRRSRALISRLSVRRVLRHRRQVIRRFLTVYLPWVWKGSLKSSVRAYCDTLKPLGIRAAELRPRIRVAARDTRDLNREQMDGIHIGICPGGSSEHKRWSEAKFAALISCLSQKGYRTGLIGSETDRAVIESIARLVRDENVQIRVCGDVQSAASVLSRCRVTISNDSGLMHLASAVSSSVVGILGPTSPVLGFAPAAQGHVVLTEGLACSPCSYHGNRPCRYGDRQCMDRIDAHDVAALVEDMICGGSSG